MLDALWDFLEGTGLGLVAVDIKGIIQVANQAAHKMFFYEARTMLGQPLSILIPKEVMSRHEQLVANIAGHFESRSMGHGRELTALRSDGLTFPVEVALHPLVRNGKLLVGALVTDITERKQLQENLLREAKAEAVEQMAAGLAHDLNNHLTVMDGYLALASGQLPQSGLTRKYLEEAQIATTKAAGITRQLLAFSRQTPATVEILDLDKLLSASEGMLKTLVGPRISLDLKRGITDKIKVKVSPDHLEQALMNLAANARDAMPNGGTLTIGVSRKNDPGLGACVALHVSDTGVGIGPEIQGRIFELFFTTKPKGKGTGLGLAAVHGIVEKYGGKISVQSQLGTGTTFTILLPEWNGKTESA